MKVINKNLLTNRTKSNIGVYKIISKQKSLYFTAEEEVYVKNTRDSSYIHMLERHVSEMIFNKESKKYDKKELVSLFISYASKEAALEVLNAYKELYSEFPEYQFELFTGTIPKDTLYILSEEHDMYYSTELVVEDKINL